MKSREYGPFSLALHKTNLEKGRPNVCQFELTYRCSFHCLHCATDCYNRPSHLNQEIDTDQAKKILDKVHQAGAIWLCFTGGDPLERPDFLDLYAYAKRKGFLITLFTNGYSMTREVAEVLGKHPPFVVEITLNAVTEERFETIAGRRGSFRKTLAGIQLLLDHRVPLVIKMQVTRSNADAFESVKNYVRELGVEFIPAFFLHPRLNGDRGPLEFRLPPERLFSILKKGSDHPSTSEGGDDPFSVEEATCRPSSSRDGNGGQEDEARSDNEFLYQCSMVGGGVFFVDPYGRMSLCSVTRTPTVDLLTHSVESGVHRLVTPVREKMFTTDSKCRNCELRLICRSCPGTSTVELGDEESPVDYYCRLTHYFSERRDDEP